MFLCDRYSKVGECTSDRACEQMGRATKQVDGSHRPSHWLIDRRSIGHVANPAAVLARHDSLPTRHRLRRRRRRSFSYQASQDHPATYARRKPRKLSQAPCPKDSGRSIEQARMLVERSLAYDNWTTCSVDDGGLRATRPCRESSGVFPFGHGAPHRPNSPSAGNVTRNSLAPLASHVTT